MGLTRQQRRTLQAKKARIAQAKEKFQTKTNCLRFIFSLLAEGARFSQMERVLLWNDIIPPSKSTYYRNLPIVEDAIIYLAKNGEI